MKRRQRGLSLLILAVAVMGSGAQAQKGRVEVEVTGTETALQNTPLVVDLPQGTKYTQGRLVLKQGKEEIPAQLFFEDTKPRLAFVLPELPAKSRRIYRLETRKPSRNKGTYAEVRLNTDAIEVHLQERQPQDKEYTYRLFTRYLTQSKPNKPFFFPILSPEGEHFTRQWPLAENPTDTHDHPHHRGLWFTHGEVNGVDFWSEEKKAGSTQHDRTQDYQSGEVFARFVATTNWLSPTKDLVATDTRTVRVFPLPNGDRLLDFEVVMRPAKSPLVLGDTKEGSFGLRVPDDWTPDRKRGGTVINSQGQKDASLWGKPANWIDYCGTLAGKPYGIAILDHPTNLRHPQTWHTRTYGLFAVNPFGLHDFGMGKKGIGDVTVPMNGTFALKYRVLFHRGDTKTTPVDTYYQGYAKPPRTRAFFIP